jgi:lipoprotein Spr/probable lipoprotein NlpC
MRIESLKVGVFIIFILFMCSCGSSKIASSAPTTQEKLEVQYQRYQGIPYRYGGTDSNGFDCSGFINKVYENALNYDLPRTTDGISQEGKKISKNNLKPGDLVFFKPSRKYMHVGIYMGNNTFIHSSTSKGVIKSKLDNVFWKDKYRFSRRILKLK